MYSFAGCKSLSKGVSEAVFRPWSVDLNGLRNESPGGECLVSYLAVSGLPRRIEDAAEDGARKMLDLARRFTRCYGGATPGSADEPDCFDDVCSGTNTANIVRARPIGPNAGNVPLVLELLDLLHIQLDCLAGDTIVRGAVAIDSLHVGPNRAGARNGDIAPNGDGARSRDGLPHRDGVPSGPALARARDMAANEATFPRITVAEEVVRRLSLDKTLRAADHFLHAEVDLVDCMLRGDGSGVHYIDYLRAGLGEFDYDFDRYAAFLGHHKRLVESGLAGTSPGTTPGIREELKRYHNARIDDDLTRLHGIAHPDECDRGMAGALAPLRIS